jgi:hypothetical protein
MYGYFKKMLMCSLFYLLSSQGYAQTCKPSSILATSPTEQFEINSDGTASDKKTGLIWKRCSEGQTWDGINCSGALTQLSWRGALGHAASHSYAGYSDWRLPNIKELSSIIERQCANPAINKVIFPATPVDPNHYWSSSPYRQSNNNGRAMTVHFVSGNVTTYEKEWPAFFRLVRNE